MSGSSVLGINYQVGGKLTFVIEVRRETLERTKVSGAERRVRFNSSAVGSDLSRTSLGGGLSLSPDYQAILQQVRA